MIGLERRRYTPRHLAPDDGVVRVAGAVGSWWTLPVAADQDRPTDVQEPDPGPAPEGDSDA